MPRWMMRRLPFALLVYSGLLVYGSLYPWQGLHLREAESLRFLLAPVPPFVTRTDLLTNVLVYVPFGFLAARWLTRRRRLRAALPIVLLLGFASSTLLECAQLLVPERVASNLDIATNTLGAVLGALVYGMSRSRRFPGQWLAALRRRWFAPGLLGGVGLVLLALWLVPQFSLGPPSLIAGRLKTGFVPVWEAVLDPERIEPWLAGLYAVEYVVLAAVVGSVLRHPPRAGWLLLAATSLFLSAKFLAAATLVKLAVTPRLLSLEFTAGLAAGALSVVRLVRASGTSARWVPVGFAVTLGLLLALLLSPATFDGSARHFNVTGIAALGAVAWPWLAALYLALSALTPRAPH